MNFTDQGRNAAIEYSGICPLESLPRHPLYFKQLTVEETVCIPREKPDVYELLSVKVRAEAEHIRLEWPQGKTAEGQTPPCTRLVMKLLLRQQILYAANLVTQPVHEANFEYMTNAFISLPPEINGIPAEELFACGRIEVTPYVEDIHAYLLDRRTVWKSITLLLNADFPWN